MGEIPRDLAPGRAKSLGISPPGRGQIPGGGKSLQHRNEVISVPGNILVAIYMALGWDELILVPSSGMN